MYYFLLSKDEFASLYKFGSIRIRGGSMAHSDVSEEAVKQLFSNADSFEYAQERLIVTSSKEPSPLLKMVDVISIFPLDTVSKNLFESQFNKDLVFSEPAFHCLAESFIRDTVLERTTRDGIAALRSIFNLDEEHDNGLIDNIINGKKLLRDYKYFDVPFTERTPISMMIAYNRYQHYPKDNRGFFYDAADCFMYGYMYSSLKERDIMLIGYDKEIIANLCQSYFSILEGITPNKTFTEIVRIVEESNPRINEAISAVYGSIRFLALYFYLKEQIIAEETISMKSLTLMNSIRKKYPEDFSKLITLIGGFFGYTWLYNRLYEFQHCKFISTHHSLDDLESISHQEVITIPKISGASYNQSDIQQSTCSSPVVGVDTCNDEAEQISQPNEPLSDISTPITTKRSETFTEKQGIEFALELDIPSIIENTFKGCKRPRKETFEAMIRQNYKEVLSLALSNDREGLKRIFPELDKKFNKKTESERLNAFVDSCLELKQRMFNE